MSQMSQSRDVRSSPIATFRGNAAIWSLSELSRHSASALVELDYASAC
jgi:hypothetical protein